MSRLDELGLWELPAIRSASINAAAPWRTRTRPIGLGSNPEWRATDCRYHNLVLPHAQQPSEHPHREEGAVV